MTDIRIDLYSDTQTRPTPGMRQAMAAAQVGDEQRGEDPTVNRLCATVAELLGKEAAVFLPSGTMCNNIAILVHCRAGDEILVDRRAHIVNSEAGAAAALAGAAVRTLDGDNGVFTADQLEQAIRENERHAPKSRLVAIEQTVNFGMGKIWPLAAVRAVAEVARRHGLAIHMDGARLLNAVVATGVPARDFAAPCDSVWLDLSKGLGCPIGGVLAGPAAFIKEAWNWKYRLGGAMRQAGVLAAAGLYALEHHVDRLAEDHANAQLFAARIAEAPGVALLAPRVDTNIVIFDVAGTGLSAAAFANALGARGVRIGAAGRTSLRAVTHLDVDRAQVEEAAAHVCAVARAARLPASA
jgi:threonine aldolase